MNKTELFRRYSIFTLSLFIIALGISVVTRSYLGTSPISSTPYVFSLNTPISMGTGLILLGVVFIIIQSIMLGVKGVKEKKFDLIIQIPITIFFGLCTDLSMWLLDGFNPEPYYLKIISLVFGSFILAIGISLEVIANVAMMGSEYTIQIASKRYNKEFGILKMISDITLVSLAIISSLLFTSKVEGVREGTVIAAIITGPFVKLIIPRLNFLRQWFSIEKKETTKKPILITISREYGSGGHLIGRKLAERLGIPFYDKNLIEMVAEEGHFSQEFVSEHEQNMGKSLFYRILMQDYEVPIEKSAKTEDILFVTQTRVINKIAEGGSCVIVGRCANYILSKYNNKIDIFLHADMEYKKQRVIEEYGIAPENAEAEILRVDKGRKNHYFFYAGRNWGEMKNYQFSFNTSQIKDEDICEIIEKHYNRKQN